MSDKRGWLCRNCVFADYKDNIQIGCSVGKLDIFRNMGTVIEEVSDNPIEHENPKEYYFIQDKFCNTWRSTDWLEKNPENPQQKVKQEIELKYDLIIFEEHKDISDLNKLEQYILYILTFDIKPNKVFFCSKSDINIVQTSKLLNRHFKKWVISNIDDDLIQDRIVDTIINKIETNYYVFSNLDSPPTNEQINKYNKLVCDEQRFIGYYQDEKISFVNRHIHQYFEGGYMDIPLLNKILDAKPDLIYL